MFEDDDFYLKKLKQKEKTQKNKNKKKLNDDFFEEDTHSPKKPYKKPKYKY